MAHEIQERTLLPATDVIAAFANALFGSLAILSVARQCHCTALVGSLPTEPASQRPRQLLLGYLGFMGDRRLGRGRTGLRSVRSGELVKGDMRLLVRYGEECFCFATEENLSHFMIYPADYRARAQLPARFTGTQRLGLPPKTLAGIAQAARERCMKQDQATRPSTSPLMAEEGLAELRDTLKDALTYIEVQQHTAPAALRWRCAAFAA